MPNLKFPRAAHGSITIGGQVIITGGGFFNNRYEFKFDGTLLFYVKNLYLE